MKNLLLISGGGGAEHEVSLRSAMYFKETIDQTLFKIFDVCIEKDKTWTLNGNECVLNLNAELSTNKDNFKMDLAIACAHGFPNETGQLPGLFEMIGLPYLGCNQETSVHCFNKMTTKLWLESHGIKTTPFVSVASIEDESRVIDFFNDYKDVFVKATNQGSSVGCYRCKSEKEVKKALKDALELSPYAVVEKTIEGREFELSSFEYNNEIVLTHPCEILAPDDAFYTYEEKYSDKSKTKVDLNAKVEAKLIKEMKRQALLAFKVLKIRHLARMDFFISNDDEVYLNEINTMPGHTNISMFPSMMEAHGIKYTDFLRQHLISLCQ